MKVLVTGCSSGIGMAIALHLARRGDRVAAGVRNPATARDLTRAIDSEALDMGVV
jgi:NAD(P)-dependent dehydrogenase (short-subunit alcohol dehydrogenase family)